MYFQVRGIHKVRVIDGENTALSAYDIGVIINLHLFLCEILSGFLFSIVYCMVYGRRVSIQYFSNKCSVICFLQGFFHFTWTEHICFCSSDINNIIK
jgi:hypothetical protein